MYEFCYEYVNSKYGQKARLSDMLETVSMYAYKEKIFLMTLQKLLKQGVILHITNQTDHFQKEMKQINERFKLIKDK